MAYNNGKFKHIFSPVKLGKFELKNRVKYAACSVSNFNTRDGFISDREMARMEVIAKTGCGMITNQGAYPDKKGEGKAYFRQLSINDDKYIPGYRKLARLIHDNGAVAIQQILHGGRYGGIDLDYCVQPSNVPQTLKHFRPPREMTKEEIKFCIGEHAEAARRSMEADFDGVEVTSFMGYLMSNFNSKFTNKRTDEYGGTLENRARFMVELIRAMRQAIGNDKLFIIRLNGIELMDEYGGNSPDECIEFMKIAEREGVDCISFVIGWHESRTGALGRDLPSDKWLYLAENAKKELKVPLAFGPRLSDPVMAENALAENKFDFWEVCRPFLADPELLHKISEDKLTTIKPCLGGLTCLARMFRNLPYICAVNPKLGHEREYKIQPAVRKKRIAVVGGGAAGLECAITAKKRGHEVEIYEKSSRFGGQLNYAFREPESGNVFLDLVKHYETEIEKYNIPVHFNKEISKKNFYDMNAEVVVVATGAVIREPDLIGRSPNIVNAFDILDGRIEANDKAYIYGGDRAGLVTAEYLASIGKNVTIIDRRPRFANDVVATFKWRHLAWLKEYGIKKMTETNVRIDENGDVYIDGTDTKIDQLIVSTPRKSVQQLYENDFASDEIYLIGDAVMPQSLYNAIQDGFKLGLRI